MGIPSAVQVAAAAGLQQAAPFVKWTGGKRQIIHELATLIPRAFGRYFEPFVGGGALFFHLAGAGRLLHGATLADCNRELMVTYKAIRDDVESLIRGLKLLTYDEKTYYQIRAAYPTPGRPTITAGQLIYLNHCCFNGLYRVNKSGKFNAPFGRYTNPTICDADNLRWVRKALRAVELLAGDFADVVRAARGGDLVYFDPPYWPVSATSDFTEYAKTPFGPAEQTRLRDTALALKRQGVYVLLSNADVEPVRQLYARGFTIRRVEARRAVNCKAGGRGKVGELLIT